MTPLAGSMRYLRETDIVRACLDLLALYPRIDAWRQNTGAMKGRYKGKRWFVRFGISGQADISGIVKPGGKRIEIEVKQPGKNQTMAQLVFMDRIRKSGGIYLLVHSVEELQAGLDCHGIKMRRGK